MLFFVYDSISIVFYFVASVFLTLLFHFYFVKRTLKFWYVHIFTCVVFFLSFFSIGLVTLDLSSSFYLQYLESHGEEYLESHKGEMKYFEVIYIILFIFWEIIYWTTFLLAWTVIPFFQAYVYQGHFVLWKRMVGVVVDNVIFYGAEVLIVIGCGVIIVLYFTFAEDSSFLSIFKNILNLSSMFILLTSISNAFGFTILVGLYGYSLASIPISLFRKAFHKKSLKYYQFLAADYSDSYNDKRDELNVLLCYLRYLDVNTKTFSITKEENLNPNEQKLVIQSDESDDESDHDKRRRQRRRKKEEGNMIGDPIGGIKDMMKSKLKLNRVPVLKKFLGDDEEDNVNGVENVNQKRKFRKYIDAIKKNCGDLYTSKIVPKKPMENSFKKTKHYEQLNGEIIAVIRDMRTNEYKFEKLKTNAFWLEDIVDSKGGKITHSAASSPSSSIIIKILNLFFFCLRKNRFYRDEFIPRVEWVLFRILWTWFYLFLLVLSIIIPIFFLWCEFTPLVQMFDERVDLSLVSLIVRLFRSQRWLVQIFSFAVISYMAFLLLYSIFRVRFFGIIQYVRFHTDSQSMLFSCVFLCRIVPAFLFNFLTLCGVTKKDKVSFFKVMANVGNFKGLSWIWFGEYFGILVPLAIPLVIIAVILDLPGRVGKLVGYNRFVLSESFFAKNDGRRMKLGIRILKQQRKKVESTSKKAMKTIVTKKKKKKEFKMLKEEEIEEDIREPSPTSDLTNFDLGRKLEQISSDEDDDDVYLSTSSKKFDL